MYKNTSENESGEEPIDAEIVINVSIPSKTLRVIDGDTVDLLIDCGFSIFTKQRVRLLVLTLQKQEQKI